LLAHGGPGCADVRSPPGEMLLLIENPVRSLDPRIAPGSYDTKLSRLVAPGLTTVDATDGVPRPLLAESIVREGPGRYLVTLRPDARFPDGSPLEAEDVVYTYASVVDPALHSTYRASFADKGISKDALEVVDARRVRFRLPRPLAT